MQFLKKMQQHRQESSANFAKKAEALEVKAGVVEGSVYDAAGIQELSKIPSREVLLSKLLGSYTVTYYKPCSCS